MIFTYTDADLKTVKDTIQKNLQLVGKILEFQRFKKLFWDVIPMQYNLIEDDFPGSHLCKSNGHGKKEKEDSSKEKRGIVRA